MNKKGLTTIILLSAGVYNATKHSEGSCIAPRMEEGTKQRTGQQGTKGRGKVRMRENKDLKEGSDRNMRDALLDLPRSKKRIDLYNSIEYLQQAITLDLTIPRP